MRRRLRVPDDVATVVRGLHPAIKARLRSALDFLREDATRGKPLRDELSGLRNFRVGRFRIIYREPSGKVLEIVAIGPRASIYRETFRLLAREESGRR